MRETLLDMLKPWRSVTHAGLGTCKGEEAASEGSGERCCAHLHNCGVLLIPAYRQSKAAIEGRTCSDTSSERTDSLIAAGKHGHFAASFANACCSSRLQQHESAVQTHTTGYVV
jgi:hypothetical protein